MLIFFTWWVLQIETFIEKGINVFLKPHKTEINTEYISTVEKMSI